MKTYCRSDVDILHRCILIFRNLFIESTDIDPFESGVTIAMACNLIYISNFLLQNSIGIIPKHGYRGSDLQSVEAQKWMQFLEIQRGVKIRRSGYGGELVNTKLMVHTMMCKVKKCCLNMMGVFSMGVQSATVQILKFHKSICFWIKSDIWKGQGTKLKSSGVMSLKT